MPQNTARSIQNEAYEYIREKIKWRLECPLISYFEAIIQNKRNASLL